MNMPNKIKDGIGELSRVSSNYEIAKKQRVELLTKQIRNLSQLNFVLKSSIQELERGPSWVRLPIAYSIWRIGSRKIWNKQLPNREIEYAKNAEELKHLRNVLTTERKKLASAGKILRKITNLKFRKINEHILPPEYAHRMTTILERLKRYPISERGIEQAVIAAEALFTDIEQYRPIAMPKVIRQEKSTPQLLPYRSSFHEPIYLPIPKNLGYVVRNLGASYDQNIQKAGRYFIPANTELKPFDRYLPLAFRERPPEMQFYPAEPDTAKRVNLRTIFDAETWDYIRSTNYAKTDNRCAVCGKRSGDLLDRMAPENIQNRADRVECHEVWEFFRPKKEYSIGVQKLKALYIVCFKCHMTFHDGIARSMLATDQDPLDFARELHSHRSHITRLDEAVIYNQMVDLNRRAKTMNKVDYWIVDLTHLTHQDYMRHVSPVFLEHNKAGVGVEQIAGFEFSTDTGERLPARDVKELYYQIAPRYPAISVESLMANRKL